MSARSLLLVLDIVAAQRLTVSEVLVLLSIQRGGHVGNELLALMLQGGIVTVDADQVVSVTSTGQRLRNSLPDVAEQISQLEVA